MDENEFRNKEGTYPHWTEQLQKEMKERTDSALRMINTAEETLLKQELEKLGWRRPDSNEVLEQQVTGASYSHIHSSQVWLAVVQAAKRDDVLFNEHLVVSAAHKLADAFEKRYGKEPNMKLK